MDRRQFILAGIFSGLIEFITIEGKQHMKILIETIPHDQQRYDTVGDWQWEDITNANPPEQLLHIRVSKMSDWRYEMLVGIHEAVEALLCKRSGITEEQVDAFDLSYKHVRQPGNRSEPGDDPHAPYFQQHQYATRIERQLSLALNVNWQLYDEEVNNL